MDRAKGAGNIPSAKALSVVIQELLDDYRRQCEREEAFAPTENARQFAIVTLNGSVAIFKVLDHPYLPLTNNEAKRTPSHSVILCRITYATRTQQGSRVFPILASGMGTCHLRQCSPWRYVAEVIAAGRAGLPVPNFPVAIEGRE